jgi:hypothetical protein
MGWTTTQTRPSTRSPHPEKHQEHFPRKDTRDSPSRQRRREREAKERVEEDTEKVNGEENVEIEAEEANGVKVRTEESAIEIEIEINAQNAEEISAEYADAQVDEAKPSQQ